MKRAPGLRERRRRGCARSAAPAARSASSETPSKRARKLLALRRGDLAENPALQPRLASTNRSSTCAGAARLQCFARHARRLRASVGGLAGRQQQSGSVEDDDVLLRPRRASRRAAPSAARHSRRHRRPSTALSGARSSPASSGVISISSISSPDRRMRPGLGVERDLVEPGAVDDQRLLDPHCGERLGDPPKHLRIGDPEQLDRRARRIDARPEQIHDRAHFELPPHQRGMLHARVIGGREQEAEAGLVEQRPRLCGRMVDLRADALRARRPSRSAS